MYLSKEVCSKFYGIRLPAECVGLLPIFLTKKDSYKFYCKKNVILEEIEIKDSDESTD